GRLGAEVGKVEVGVLVQHLAASEVAELQPAIALVESSKREPGIAVVAAETGKRPSVWREAGLQAIGVVGKVQNTAGLSRGHIPVLETQPAVIEHHVRR